MLTTLAIRNFILVDQLELDFANGFTVLTGETGAGKSILIDALALVLGGRGEALAVRQGAERAELAAEFTIDDAPHLARWIEDNELGGDDDVCLIRRVLDASGRS